MLNIALKIVRKIRYVFSKAYNRILFARNPQITLTGKTKPIVIGHVYLKIEKNASLVVGDKFLMYCGFGQNPIGRNIFSAIYIEKDASVKIGDNVGVSNSTLWAAKGIFVGNNVNIGADSLIIDTDCHSLYFADRRIHEKDQTNKKAKEIYIGDDVLIGARCIILKGVSIGARSIVGAGSVVTKSIPADEIWAGNPAVFVRKINYVED